MVVLVHVDCAGAFYSNAASDLGNDIKTHVRASRKVNGDGNLATVIENLIKEDQKSIKDGKVIALPVNASIIMNQHDAHFYDDLFYAPLDSITMIFNLILSEAKTINSCLRDDIWALEELGDIAFRESAKAFLLLDDENGVILWKDYRHSRDLVKFLKKYGNEPKTKVGEVGKEREVIEVLYGSTSADYYYLDAPYDQSKAGCPGEFYPAIRQVVRSFDVLMETSKNSLSGFGDIKALAEARAKNKADLWIQKNQIKLAFGGESGGNPTNLLSQNSRSRMMGSLKTNLKALNAIVGGVTPLFDRNLWETSFEAIGVGFGASEEILADNDNNYWDKNCAMYVNGNGLIECTKGEMEAFKNCAIYVDDKFMPCRVQEWKDLKSGECTECRYVNERTTAFQKLAEQEENINRHYKKKRQARRMFDYNLQLNDVSHQGLVEFNKLMVGLNKEVNSAYSRQQGDENKALPELLNNIQTVKKKNCTNR